MTTIQDAQALAMQVHEDALMFNALNPGQSGPLLGSLTWGGLTFAEYVTSTDSGSLAQYLPSPTLTGNPDAFISGVFQNALGRSASSADLTFYEHVIGATPHDALGFAEVVMYVGLSAESQAHNTHLTVLV